MKYNILLSIRPEYVEKIISGEKKYDYRTKAAKRNVDKIIIYETTPVKKVIAYFIKTCYYVIVNSHILTL